MSHDQIVALLVEQRQSSERITSLTTRVDELKQQVDWFKRQLFGPRADRRLLPENNSQLALGESLRSDETAAPETTTVKSHRRRARSAKTIDESSVRFDESVPVEVIEVPDPEVEKDPESYYRVGTKQTDRLAQRPGAYVVLRYVRGVYKHKDTGAFSCAPAPAGVLEKSMADVSFLAGLLIDKFRYYLPLYRQHQRLAAGGITIGRSTLTSLVQRTADLLHPIYDAQLDSILTSEVLVMDETPIRAGPGKKRKMKTGYFWPIYGDKDEMAFPFSPSRGAALVQEVLREYCGVLVTDGYEVYDRYAATVNGLVHAQCWVHARRYFIKAQAAEPALAGHALDLIDRLYDHEAVIREKSEEKRQQYRGEHCKALVDEFFTWLEAAMAEHLLLPSSPFTKAGHYALEREQALRVFLEYPNVPVDTNHLEREIRPIAVGRKNWLFCWTELGAYDVGVIQSLLTSCRLQGVDPYVYLVDVLQRVETHPAKDVHLLTPRLWKEHFAANPLRSDLDLLRKPNPST